MYLKIASNYGVISSPILMKGESMRKESRLEVNGKDVVIRKIDN